MKYEIVQSRNYYLYAISEENIKLCAIRIPFAARTKNQKQAIGELKNVFEKLKGMLAINRTCYRILFGLDIVDVHPLRHGTHFQFPRTLKRRTVGQQLIADLDALIVLAETEQREGFVEWIHGSSVLFASSSFAFRTLFSDTSTIMPFRLLLLHFFNNFRARILVHELMTANGIQIGGNTFGHELLLARLSVDSLRTPVRAASKVHFNDDNYDFIKQNRVVRNLTDFRCHRDAKFGRLRKNKNCKSHLLLPGILIYKKAHNMIIIIIATSIEIIVPLACFPLNDGLKAQGN